METTELIKIASFAPLSLKLPKSWIGHLAFAAWLIKEIKPKIFVELGTHSGNSYFSFCQAVSEANLTTKCYAVDNWQGDEHAGYYGEEIYEHVYAYNKKHYAAFSCLLRMLFDNAIDHFSDESIDLLHIDGLHTYEAVKHDFESWLPKMAHGAVIMFHDTKVRENGFGVWKLWEELQIRYPLNIEFDHSHGLGILKLDDGNAEKIFTWLVPDEPEQKILKNYFTSLGTQQLALFEKHQALTESQKSITDQTNHIHNLEIHIDGLERTITDQANHIHNLEKHIEGLESTITDQTNHIHNLEKHIEGLERTITDQANHIHNLEKHIEGLERTITDQTNHIHNLEKHIEGLESTITDQANHIHNVKTELVKFQSSLYGRLKSAIQKLRKLIIFG